MGGSQLDAALGAAIDPSGNVYAVGLFVGQATFGPFTLQASDASDGFLVKISPQGEVLWARRFGGTNIDALIGVGTDAAGNVFVGGYFQGTLDGDLGQGTNHGGTDSDIFIGRVSPDGDLIWGKTFGSVGGEGLGDIEVEPDGRVTASLMIGNKCDLGGGPLGGNWPRAALLTLDADGNHLNSLEVTDKDEGGSDIFVTTAMAPGGDRLALVLYAQGFYPDPDGPKAPWGEGQEQNVAIVRVTPQNKTELMLAIPSSSIDFTRGFAVNKQGQILLPWTFSAASVDVGGITLKNAGIFDMGLALLDPSGAPIWAKSMGGALPDGAFSAAFDDAGDAYVAMGISGTVDLGDGPIKPPKSPAAGLLKLSPQGDFRWFLDLGNAPASKDSLYHQVRPDLYGKKGVVVASRFFGSFSLAGVDLKSAGDTDALVVRVAR